MSLAARLGSICSDVSEAEDRRDEAGRDWWPVAMVWEREGRDPVPSRPDVVARPNSVEEVSAVLAMCNSERIPVTAFGGRSGVCGGSRSVYGGVALDLNGLSGIEAVDHESLLVTLGAGTNGREAEESLRADHGVTIGHWPQSIDLASVGGWIACRGAGQYSTRYGTVADMVEGLEVVLADGSVVRTGWRGPRSAMGPDLTQLFVGSEGTLGVITSARLRLHHLPVNRWQGTWVFPDLSSGLAACRRVMQGGATPAVLRLYDRRESKRHFGEEANGCALVVLDEAPTVVLEATRAVVEQACGLAERGPDTWVDHWLESRNDVSGLGKAVEAGLAVDTCEIAAPWSVIAGLADAAPAAVMSVEGSLAATVHASHHYSDGACLYITFAGKSDDVDRWYRGVWDALMASTLAAGGTISHHHGIGLVRGAYMAEALGPAFGVLTSLKTALDPVGILNPGKLGLPSPFGPSPWP